MEQQIWTEEAIAAGYRAMAELNQALAEEFTALEDEAAVYFDSLNQE